MLERIGNCRIVEEVASGGMAVVYRAVQDPLGRTVAIKALKTSAAAEENVITRFEREAKVLAGIDAITANSYTVRSTISPRLQRAVEGALQEGLSRYERGAGRVQFRGAEANLAQAVQRAEAETKAGDKRPSWQRAHIRRMPRKTCTVASLASSALGKTRQKFAGGFSAQLPSAVTSARTKRS